MRNSTGWLFPGSREKLVSVSYPFSFVESIKDSRCSCYSTGSKNPIKPNSLVLNIAYLVRGCKCGGWSLGQCHLPDPQSPWTSLHRRILPVPWPTASPGNHCTLRPPSSGGFLSRMRTVLPWGLPQFLFHHSVRYLTNMHNVVKITKGLFSWDELGQGFYSPWWTHTT